MAEARQSLTAKTAKAAKENKSFTAKELRQGWHTRNATGQIAAALKSFSWGVETDGVSYNPTAVFASLGWFSIMFPMRPLRSWR